MIDLEELEREAERIALATGSSPSWVREAILAIARQEEHRLEAMNPNHALESLRAQARAMPIAPLTGNRHERRAALARARRGGVRGA